MPLNKWYYEDTSIWTLDYPPFFSYFEFCLSKIAKYFDSEMLNLNNLNYASQNTILFQRLSVILSDLVYAIGVKKCLNGFTNNKLYYPTVALLLGNIGLFMVDHIHFQYNGLLFGILLLCISKIIDKKFLHSAVYFTILINMKHIFLYMAPAYGIFLLKYCSMQNNRLLTIIKFGIVALGITSFSFGPFYQHIPQVYSKDLQINQIWSKFFLISFQILSRLFPFKRGLSHAYWAPNFYAVYNFVDKILSILLKVKKQSSSTSGLVQTFDHEILPSISPTTTFVLTVLFTVPCLWKIWTLYKITYVFIFYNFEEDRFKSLDMAIITIICNCTRVVKKHF